tara:strand:- start:69 stop:560 length:492 start_codon:yes stop_codon:yes gene_type:complete
VGDLGEVHHPGLLEGDLVLVDAVLGEGHGELVRVAGHLDLPVERLARVELDADVSDGLVEVVELELVLGVGEVVETEGVADGDGGLELRADARGGGFPSSSGFFSARPTSLRKPTLSAAALAHRSYSSDALRSVCTSLENLPRSNTSFASSFAATSSSLERSM